MAETPTTAGSTANREVNSVRERNNLNSAGRHDALKDTSRAHTQRQEVYQKKARLCLP